MSQYKWIISKNDKEKARILAEECGIEPLIALLLLARGIDDPVEIDEFLSQELEFASPYLLADMEKAVKRINTAIENFEFIAVYGDYDADGITAVALLYSYLEEKGAKVMYYIPDRLDEGYGMHVSSVKKLAEMGVNLIITVDNGICSNEEVAYASALGIDTIITDHHLPCGDLPAAVAVIDPHREDNNPYLFKDYAGVGVAFKLICALEDDIDIDFVMKYADLVALGTVADIVPLLSENRMLAKLGLEVINAKRRVGINALLEVSGHAGKTVNTNMLSFGLAPRINAAGRMGNCRDALHLLLSDDGQEALELAGTVNRYNSLRKTTEQTILEEATEIIERDGLADGSVIIVSGEGWHQGVLGIVAARLVHHYGRPAIVLSLEGETAKGSARSFEGFNIFESVKKHKERLLTFGGHKMALGLSLKREDVDAFRKAVNGDTGESAAVPMPVQHIDCCLNPVGVNLDTAYLLKELEPFGQSNNIPLFGLMDMKIESIHPLSDGRHISLNVSKNGYVVRTVIFGTGIEHFPYIVGDTVDLAAVLDVNSYKNNPSLSVVVKDIRPGKIDYEKYYSQAALYGQYAAGAELTGQQLKILAPTREEVGTVFRYLRSQKSFRGSFDVLILRLSFGLEYAKLRTAIDILKELGFVHCKIINNYIEAALCDTQKKQPIEDSETYIRLNQTV